MERIWRSCSPPLQRAISEAHKVDRDLQESVDRLLLDVGEYQPLEYLLQEGRLDYNDYEAWRRGELEYLEDMLFGDPLQVRENLAEVEQYLKRLGWESETADYRSRGGDSTDSPLRFSRDQASDARFRRRFRKAEDRPQLDLFTDNPANSLVNGVAAALTETDAQGARELLDRLLEIAPDHARLGDLECLLEAVEALDTPVQHIDEALAQAADLLAPTAVDLLGAGARHLMIPVWRRLATALHGVGFDAQVPERHASYAATRAMDWQGVRGAIERESRWEEQAVLIQRHALACERVRDDAAANRSWALLCWHFPDSAAALDSSLDTSLSGDWDDFQDLEPPLPAEAFPAWRLMRRPGLAQQLAIAEDCGPASYHLVRLLCLQKIGQATDDTRDVIALRAELKTQDPALLQQCLQLLG